MSGLRKDLPATTVAAKWGLSLGALSPVEDTDSAVTELGSRREDPCGLRESGQKPLSTRLQEVLHSG